MDLFSDQLRQSLRKTTALETILMSSRESASAMCLKLISEIGSAIMMRLIQ
jgi:hypothetical protein